MDESPIFNFTTDLSKVKIPKELNNPFGRQVPEIAQLAAEEFHGFIDSVSRDWNYDFHAQKGKMFGVLVVQKPDNSYGYLGAISGKLPGNATCPQLTPSIFDDSVDDFFINKGMKALTDIGTKIKAASDSTEIDALKAIRKEKSYALQRQLFSHYRFLNLRGVERDLLAIFSDSSLGNPPSAAGECAAPKLLHFAFAHQLTPIALAEFWWGKPRKHLEREHKEFYPACKNKCRPILEYMLDDRELFNTANFGFEPAP